MSALGVSFADLKPELSDVPSSKPAVVQNKSLHASITTVNSVFLTSAALI